MQDRHRNPLVASSVELRLAGVVRDARDARGVLRHVVSGLDALNRRHPWSHNDHYHRWIMRRLPERRCRALDVGCGRGELLELLVARFERVDGVDVDAEMARVSGRRFAEHDKITIRHESFERVVGRYDLIVMVAVLHHLDLKPALRRVVELLDDGGRVLVVGLARPATPLDQVWDLASAVLNPIIGLAKHPHVARNRAATPPFSVVEPTLSFDEIRADAQQMLPGARMRRRLFFRYSLEWTKPPSTNALVNPFRGT